MDVTSKPDVGFYEQFTLTIILAVPIALLISLALLRIYRRAVVRSMQRRIMPGAVLENTAAKSGEPPSNPLQIVPHDAPPDGVRFAVRRARWPSAAVEVCAGLAYAIVMTSSWFAAGRFGFEWHVFLWMSIWFAWPMIFTVGLAVAVSWRELAILVAGYVLIFAGTYGLFFVSGTAIPARQILAQWLWTNGPATLLALAFIARPIRAVGSQVLVFMIAAVGGAIFVILY